MIWGRALLDQLGDRLSGLRGRVTPNAEMDKVTWFRAGGPAEAMFQPADEDDLAAFLKAVPEPVPVMVVSYKDREEDRRRGLDAGADYYLAKASFHEGHLR